MARHLAGGAGAYRGRRRPHVERLEPLAVLGFMSDRRDALPPVVETQMLAASDA